MFHVKYCILNFRLEIVNNCILPSHKTSALRGGMGNVLLSLYCIGDRNCGACSFSQNCAVKNIMHPGLDVEVSFLPKGGTSSPGFVIECLEDRREYSQGDILEFNLILFGSTIGYLPQFIYSFDRLGRTGIGKGRNKYRLLGVYNIDFSPVFENGFLNKENIKISSIGDYINSRKKSLFNINGIKFLTPFRFVKKGKLSNVVTFQDIIYSISRRLSVLNAIEGRLVEGVIPGDGQVVSSQLVWSDIQRYSSTQRQEMMLGGLVGTMEFSREVDDYMDYIIAGELTHIGKNTSFGLGKYVIV